MLLNKCILKVTHLLNKPTSKFYVRLCFSNILYFVFPGNRQHLYTKLCFLLFKYNSFVFSIRTHYADYTNVQVLSPVSRKPTTFVPQTVSRLSTFRPSLATTSEFVFTVSSRWVPYHKQRYLMTKDFSKILSSKFEHSFQNTEYTNGMTVYSQRRDELSGSLLPPYCQSII